MTSTTSTRRKSVKWLIGAGGTNFQLRKSSIGWSTVRPTHPGCCGGTVDSICLLFELMQIGKSSSTQRLQKDTWHDGDTLLLLLLFTKWKKKENIWFTSNDFRCCAAPLAIHSYTLRKPHKFGHVALHVAGDDEWAEVRRGKDRISYLWEHRAVNAGYNWTSMDRDPYSVARRQFVEQDQRKDTSGSPLNTWAIPSPPLSR